MEKYNKKEYKKLFNKLFKEARTPDKLGVLHQFRNYLDKKEFSRLLCDCWVQTEFPNQYPKYMILEMFNLADKEILMSNDYLEDGSYSNENLKRYNNLGRFERVYRGVQDCFIKSVKEVHDSKKSGRMKIKVFSWTTTRKKAEWFANRWRKDGTGKVYSALIPKQDIFMFNNGRDESEVVLNPNKLFDLKEISK